MSVFLVIGNYAFAKTTPDCATGWEYFEKACYRPVAIHLTWPQAEAHCQRETPYSHLASVHSQLENDFIYVLMKKSMGSNAATAYWIGAHDTFEVAATGKMNWTNATIDTDFTLAGLSSDHRVQYFLFVIFLLLYLLSVCGNITIMMTIWMERKLHTPMYFFLGNLSFLDIFYSSVTVPKMLISLLGGSNEISYKGCMTQLYFYVSCCSTECLLLSIMGFDRYVAICNPMHYTITMNKSMCLQLAIGLWLIGFTTSIIHTVFTARLPFCDSHMIPHFFCDIPPMLKLSCSDTFMNKILILTAGGFLGLSSFVLTLVSYVQIISAILKIHTKVGRSKTFSTCGSHLVVVLLFFGSISFMYMRPTSNTSMEQDQLVSLLYAVVTPALNPIIYTLRNKEVKRAFKKTFSKILILK
ncbi:olfactory receptor 5AU1 [Pelodytes ibericus]